MLADQQGNPVSGATPDAIELFDRSMRAFNIYQGDPVAPLDQAIRICPEFAMAHIARAHLFASSSEPAAMLQARAALDQARMLPLSERERSHIAALDRLLAGEWSQAALLLDRHNMHHPRDLLALQSGHLIDFFCANARNLRDRPARVLPGWSPDVPGYPILLGMYAFGLEECGEYAHAEDVGRHAVALEPLDCWAHHAVTHVMEMQGRPEDGIGWMIARESYWAGADNAFKVHNWWHRALFHLELGQYEEALLLYDTAVREEHNSIALQLVDASALLWRLHLCGVDPGKRWDELATNWMPHADGKTYAFNDWHAVMALLGAGRDAHLERVLSALRSAGSSPSEADRWASRNALPLVEGFVAFWRGDHASAVDHLLSSRTITNAFGGSHAQRDVIDWTLLEAAARGGMRDVANALLNERVARKPHSPRTRKWVELCATEVAAQTLVE